MCNQRPGGHSPLEIVRIMDDRALRSLALLELEAADPEGLARSRALVDRDVERAQRVAEWAAEMETMPPMVHVSRDDLRAALDGDPDAIARLRERLDP